MDLNLEEFVKKFPLDCQKPTKLSYEDLIATPLTRSNLEDDLTAVNSSIDLIRETRGGSWPEKVLKEEENLLDLAWHEREFRDGDSLAYVIYDINDNYIGCFYLYPMGVRTLLTERLLKYDVDVSWWVSAAAYKQGYYPHVYQALKKWFEDSFDFENPFYSNDKLPE